MVDELHCKIRNWNEYLKESKGTASSSENAFLSNVPLAVYTRQWLWCGFTADKIDCYKVNCTADTKLHSDTNFPLRISSNIQYIYTSIYRIKVSNGTCILRCVFNVVCQPYTVYMISHFWETWYSLIYASLRRREDTGPKINSCFYNPSSLAPSFVCSCSMYVMQLRVMEQWVWLWYWMQVRHYTSAWGNW
jgi:hypothetical protein